MSRAESPNEGGRSVLVLGSGRSGTSMLAGTLARSGWYAGEDPYPGRDSNPKGFFETREINGLNEHLLAGVQPRESDLRAWQRWLAEVELDPRFDVPADLRERMRRLAERRPFVFKDPRFCYTLPAWRESLGDFGRLCIFREPLRTAASILKECRSQEYLAGLAMDEARALRVWTRMYEHVLERHADEGDWLFLHCDQVLTEAGLDRLEAFLGAPVARDFPDAALQRERTEEPAAGRTQEVYERLCELSGHPAPRAESVSVPRDLPAPELSVILCSYDRREVLRECLDSFQRQTAAGRFELVVVNDGSRDGTREMLDGYRFRVSHEVLHRENGGLAAARNSGLAAARGRLLLFINDDTIAHPELVERHLAAHAAHEGERISVLGSFVQPRSALANNLMRVLEDTHLTFCYAGMVSGRRYDWMRWWTCNVSAPASAVEEAGGFDETFRHYGCEDTDLALRLDRLGLPVLYEAEASAVHRHVMDFEELSRRSRTVARAYVRFFRKHPGALEHPDWAWVRGVEADSAARALLDLLPERGRLEAAARELARIDLDRLGALGESATSTVDAVQRQLTELLNSLNRVWWLQGFVDGLREHGFASFDELAANAHPLATGATHRYLAWPRYDVVQDLDRLFGEVGRALADRDDSCLCLRHDEAVDGPLPRAVERLQEAYDRQLGNGERVEILMVTEPLGPSELAKLGRSVDAVVRLADDEQVGPERSAFLRGASATVQGGGPA